MIPGDFPLVLYHGDTAHWQFRFWADAAKTVPANLAGVTVKAELRDTPGGNLILTFATAVLPPNTVRMDLTPAAAMALPDTGGAWDLQLTYPSGDVATPLAGLVEVTMDVTDSRPLVTPAPARPATASAATRPVLRRVR